MTSRDTHTAQAAVFITLRNLPSIHFVESIPLDFLVSERKNGFHPHDLGFVKLYTLDILFMGSGSKQACLSTLNRNGKIT